MRVHLSGKKKAHKHKLVGVVGLGTTAGLSQGQTRPMFFKGKDRAWTDRGGTYHRRGGPKTFFDMVSPPLSLPPRFAAL